MDDTVTKKDLVEFEVRFEAKMDIKLEALEKRLEARIDAKINKAVEDLTEIILTFMNQVDARLRVLEEAHKS